MFWDRSRLPDVAAELATMLTAPGPAPRDWEVRRGVFAKLLAKATPDEVDRSLTTLCQALAQVGAERVGAAALLVGILVEAGADPIRGGSAILARLQSTVDSAPAPQAITSVRALCAAALACLRRSKELRKEVGSRELIRKSLRRFRKDLPEASFLMDLLSVADDQELVVLHQHPPLGFVIRITGIADNFQLHTLLCAALVRPGQDGFIAGTPPSPAVLAAARGEALAERIVETATFNLVAWDGSWIWNEGKPADIPALDGTPVVRLEELPYQRSWNAGAKFPGMRADAQVDRRLSDDEVQAWWAKMRPTQKPGSGGSADPNG